MGDRKKENPIQWDALTKEAEHTVWETMLESEPYAAVAAPTNPGSLTMLIDW